MCYGHPQFRRGDFQLCMQMSMQMPSRITFLATDQEYCDIVATASPSQARFFSDSATEQFDCNATTSFEEEELLSSTRTRAGGDTFSTRTATVLDSHNSRAEIPTPPNGDGPNAYLKYIQSDFLPGQTPSTCCPSGQKHISTFDGRDTTMQNAMQYINKEPSLDRRLHYLSTRSLMMENYLRHQDYKWKNGEFFDLSRNSPQSYDNFNNCSRSYMTRGQNGTLKKSFTILHNDSG